MIVYINTEVKEEISDCDVSGIISQKYTGDKVTLEDLQVFDVNGPLEEERDYTVSYKNNTKVGTATVVIKGIGNYRGSISKEFKITGKAKTKPIYFAGKYNNEKYDLSLYMNQYSSPEGKKVGNFKLTIGIRIYLDIEGELKKVKQNTYEFKDGKSKITFKVYKNKVLIGMNKTAHKNYYDYRGTYKLKKRYYS